MVSHSNVPLQLSISVGWDPLDIRLTLNMSYRVDMTTSEANRKWGIMAFKRTRKNVIYFSFKIIAFIKSAKYVKAI